MAQPRGSRKTLIIAVAVVALVLLLPGASLVYNAGGGESCTRCHEIQPAWERWTNSAHREVPCQDCHGGTLTTDLRFHTSNLRRLIHHLRGDVPAQVRLVDAADIERITAKCRGCHRREYADWMAGPHSATYADIFLDKEHNTKRLLMDDCFRCHGMHFPGSIEELVEPVATQGPWRLKRPELAGKPVIPCITCHEVHRRGEPRQSRDGEDRAAEQPEQLMPSSLALFDRRTQVYLGAAAMPVPLMKEGERAVKVSPDPRQSLCYQCHAARASAQVGTGDDRTPRGVHEGIGCLACHAGHAMETRASCANCHPRFSNCGMDNEKLNSLMRDPRNRFDIHTVKCADCHPKGVPPRRYR